MTSLGEDEELDAIQVMIAALTPLDADAQERALEYVFKRLGIRFGGSQSPASHSEPSVRQEPSVSAAAVPARAVTDIRTLRESKQPRSGTEMAAVVAYYLAELAPPDERKEAIATADIEKYFKQAGHRLPTAPQYTLSNAASAGYFDSAGRGLYKLNPVGYNLVAHSLPSDRSSKASTEAKPRTRKSAKSSQSKPASKGPGNTKTARAQAKRT